MNLRTGDKKLRQAYHNTFNTPEGQIVLRDLVSRHPLFKRGLAETNPTLDNNHTYYQEGQRSVLIHIYRLLGRDPHEEQPTRVINEMPGE
jgi:hypothetical protein